jgi:hypothetical protein
VCCVQWSSVGQGRAAAGRQAGRQAGRKKERKELQYGSKGRGGRARWVGPTITITSMVDRVYTAKT